MGLILTSRRLLPAPVAAIEPLSRWAQAKEKFGF